MPFDIYSVNVHTGEKQLVGRSYRTRPRWSMNGKWAVMYDPIAQVWNKFDGKRVRLPIFQQLLGIRYSRKLMTNQILHLLVVLLVGLLMVIMC